MSFKHISYENMQTFSAELKTKYATKTEVSTLSEKVDELVTTGGEPNVLEGVKVNGTALAIADKLVDILIATGATDGTLSVNGVDVAVKGLAALAYKANVSESDLDDALAAVINAKANQSDLDTLTGEGEGSIAKMIDDAFDEFAAEVSDDGVVNSYKELIDWAAEHGAEATELAAGISSNTTAINDLKAYVGTIPEDATSTTVVAYIAEAIAALSIGDYAKTTEVTTAIETALADYYTKTEIDTALGDYVKTADIETVTEAEMQALLADETE